VGGRTMEEQTEVTASVFTMSHTHTCVFCRIEDEEADKRLMATIEIERKNARTNDLLKAKDADIQKVLK